jgi:hypothetical protein
MLRRRAVLAACVALVACLAPGAARAHGVGTSQIEMTIDGSHLEGEWDLNLRDARLAVDLDPQLGGEAGWQDLRHHEAELRALLLRSLAITADSLPCRLQLAPKPMEWDTKWNNVRFHIVAECPVAPKRIGLECNLLFDKDPTHRAYFSIEDDRVTNVGVFRANLRSVTVSVRQFHFLDVMLEFTREGIWHIWTGPDHILFLLALLLPAGLLRVGAGWTPRVGLWRCAEEVLKVVTAFTVAHSATLALSFFGVLRPPAQWVEVGIALSVFAAAWNNLRPFLPGRAWVMALSFGLVHGLGFAGALNNLSLPRHARLLALGTFNIGVEIGQLGIVAVMLPVLYAASRRRWYPRFVMGIGSLAIAWMAVLWILERGFSLQFFARH